MKICTTCKQELTLKNAFRNKRDTEGLASYCKECTNKQNKIRRERMHEAWNIVEALSFSDFDDVPELKDRAIKLVKSVGKR